MRGRPTILTFDSGLGGLSVLAEIRALLPGARHVYLADDAVFPYGALSDAALVARVVTVMQRFLPVYAPDVVVIACNTASTLVLPHLRAAFPMPIVGTVPAIKPAALRTASGLFSVLATPGTVRRDYTHDLISRYAPNAEVTLVGCGRLALLAEQALRGEHVADGAIVNEILPAFVQQDGRRTDTVVLACTHYPLLQARLAALAPWPVTWVNPAAAIARRVADVLGKAAQKRAQGEVTPRDGEEAGSEAVFTGLGPMAVTLVAALRERGLATIAKVGV
jgi:glutamate racemase